MKLLCWLIDHNWTDAATDADGEKIWCDRCLVEPYDDTTLPEWFRNTRIVPRARAFAKRVRVWLRSRGCWVKDHEWGMTSEVCQKCGQTGTEVAESGEWPLPVWRKLWRGWLADRFYVVKQRMRVQDIYAVSLLGWSFGVERSTIYIKDAKYMERHIAYLGPVCLRLHKFFRGDDDRASHTHPWAFVTFPFRSYVEHLFDEGKFVREQVVKKFRFHYRPATHEHVVKGPMWTVGGNDLYYQGAPLYSNEPYGFDAFYTFVITGPRNNDWGFYPEPGKFVYWRDYK